VSPTSRRDKRTDLRKRETGILAQSNQGYLLGARSAIVPASVRSPTWRQQSNSLVVTQRRGRQPRSTTQLTDQQKSGPVRHMSPLDLKCSSTWMMRPMKQVSSIMPPRIALIAMLAMLALHVMAPLAIIVPPPFSYAGGVMIAVGVAMIVWSRRAFQGAGTPITPFTESTMLVRHGLYRWSRNPMYVGAVLLVAGVAVLLGSVTPLLVAVGYFVVLQEGFVRHEERLLEQRFGEEYRTYRRSVRRWF
jgi:protein-S-isoprenylcysteine O-methyltransferase Ste14